MGYVISTMKAWAVFWEIALYVYGDKEQKHKILETVSKTVKQDIEAKESNKGLNELLLPETLQAIWQSLSSRLSAFVFPSSSKIAR